MTLDSWELFSGGGNESQDYTLPGREARDHKATPDGDGSTRNPETLENQGPRVVGHRILPITRQNASGPITL
jgi:hypothetical protein